MKIGIISDSHDHHKNVDKAVSVFNKHEVEYVFHAGDIVAPFTAKAFEKLEKAQFISVYGNNDGEVLFLEETIKGFGGQIHRYGYKGMVQGKAIYMTHVQHDVDEIARSQKYDLLIYGHTHKQDVRQQQRTLVVNPGESTDWITGTAQVVILEMDDMSWLSVDL